MDDMERSEIHRLLVSKFAYPAARAVIDQCLEHGRTFQNQLSNQGVTRQERQWIMQQIGSTLLDYRP